MHELYLNESKQVRNIQVKGEERKFKRSTIRAKCSNNMTMSPYHIKQAQEKAVN